jgi:hypothetical protein
MESKQKTLFSNVKQMAEEEFQKNKIEEVSNLFVKELLEFNGVELILLSKNFNLII